MGEIGHETPSAEEIIERRRIEAERAEDDAREAFEERQRRTQRLMNRVHGPEGPTPFVGAYTKGMALIDVCEDAVQACDERGVAYADAWVELPRGYATVEFMLMVLALGGAA